MSEGNIASILDRREQDQLLLSEAEGKQLIRLMGIHVPEGTSVSSVNEAKQVAQKVGFPLVIKGLPAGVTHKSDHNLIQLGIFNEKELESSFLKIADKCEKINDQWKVLVEQQKEGDWETVFGLTTDAVFGKVIMFGIGGIFVEVLKDVSFRLCPITRRDAEDMIENLQASKIFKGVRGRPPVNTEQIIELLIKIGGHEGIAEKYGDAIDVLEINPAVLDGEGNLTALDAVVRLSPVSSHVESPGKTEESVDMKRLFSPESIGVVGVSPERPGLARDSLEASLQMGYKGKVFPINPKHDGKKLFGWRIYDSIGSVPENIDYLYISIPAAGVPGVIKEGKGKVRFAHIITSGFGEIGPEGKKLEQELVNQARESNIRLIGPNCLGMYSPEAGITLIDGTSKEPGNIGIISQSGGLTTDIVRMGGAVGLKFSQAISIGNSIDLGVEDFLDYMGRDPQTKIIGIYAEHVKDGARLSRLLSEVCRFKPVLILKGGRSPLGAKAASSHTGALVSDIKLWESMCRQHGAIFVESIKDFVNDLLAFQNLEICGDNTVFLFGQSGGTTVLAADLCYENSLSVPELGKQLEQEVLSLGIPPGTSVKNPIDAPIGTLAVANGGIVRDIFNLVGGKMNFSYELMHFNVQNILSYSRNGMEIIHNMVNLAIERGGAQGSRSKKLALVIRGNREKLVEDIVREQSEKAREAGVPVFPDLDDALKSIGTLAEYGARFHH